MPEAEGTIGSILSWSGRLPPWQQDALRRLIVQRGLSSKDKAELLAMAREWAGLPAAGTVVSPCPLEAAHFPSQVTGAAALRLLAIKELTGVNALAEGQILPFGPAGLTVVYGDNGAGKSGYFRVLKHGCQARAVETILGDVRNASSPAPRAIFEVVGDGDGEAPRPIHWDGGIPSPELKQFSLFDGECGRQIIGTASDPVFLPVGLEAFSPFASLLDEFKALLETEISRLRDTQHLAVCLSELRGDHEVGRLLGSFPERVTEVAINSLAAFSEVETEEWRSIEVRLKELEAGDPAAKIARLDSFKRRLGQERMRLTAFRSEFEPEILHNLITKWEARRVALEARAQAQALQTGDDPLPGVGSDPWRELFQAARAYSTQQAYPGQKFPVIDPGARCVLCMQPIEEEGAERLRRFEAFVQDSSERLVSKADSEWSIALARLADARLEPTNSVLLDEVRGEVPSLHSELIAGCDELRQCHVRALESCRSGTHPGDLLPRIDIIGSLLRVELSLDERIKSLSSDNRDAEVAPLRIRQAALKARLNLGTHKPALVDALNRKVIADRAAFLLSKLATRPVTEAQKALATEAVGGRYGEALKRELEALGINRFQMGYKPVAAKGQVLQQLHFPDAPKVAKPELVLSEGEHRVAALAAFLAEVSLRPVAAGIILDDPVSSLDHRWAERVAKRLVDEAKVRQVIVFTHHLHFLYTLRRLAEALETRVPFKPQTIHWSGSRPGGVSDGLPWKAKDIDERINSLNKMLADARRHYEEDQEGEDYAALRSRFVGYIRSTWERLVEERLFNSVIARFQSDVSTLKLLDVVVEDQDYQAVFRGMTWSSGKIEAHDHSIHVAEGDLTPNDLDEALSHLTTYRDQLKVRQRAVSTSRR